jgi:hypothetical protein
MRCPAYARRMVEWTHALVEVTLWQATYLAADAPGERDALQPRMDTLRAASEQRAAERDVRLPATVKEWGALFHRLHLGSLLSFLTRNHNFLCARVEPAAKPARPRPASLVDPRPPTRQRVMMG